MHGVFEGWTMKLGGSLVAGVAAAALACGGALAQDRANLLSPVMGVELTAPRYFEGLYTGVIVGATGNDHFNLITVGTALDRFGLGGVIGWNYYLTPDVVVGIEARTLFSSDFQTSHGYDLFGLAHLGFQTSDDVMFYFAGGVGVVDGVAALAFGEGVEWRVWENFTARAEALAYSQIGPASTGITRPGVTGWSLTLGALWHPDGAGKLSGPGIVMADWDQPMDFSGPYAGMDFGAFTNFPYNFFPNNGWGGHLTRVEVGGMAGWNHYLTANVVGGVEVQGGVLFDTSGDVTYDVLGLARLGFQPFDRALVYAVGGAGVLQDKAAFVFGGGVEYALWDQASLRAEYLQLGELSATPIVPGISATKVTVGAVWHH